MAAEHEPDQSGNGAPASDEASEEKSAEKLRRRAGCIWGVLTEPLLLLGVTFLAGILGRAYLVRRAQRLKERAEQERCDGES